MLNWILLSNTKELITDTLSMGGAQELCWGQEARHKNKYYMVLEPEKLGGDE